MSDFWKNIIKLLLPYLVEFLNGLIEDKLGVGTKKSMHHRVKLDKFLADLAKDTKDQKLLSISKNNNKQIKSMIKTYGVNGR